MRPPKKNSPPTPSELPARVAGRKKKRSDYTIPTEVFNKLLRDQLEYVIRHGDAPFLDAQKSLRLPTKTVYLLRDILERGMTNYFEAVNVICLRTSQKGRKTVRKWDCQTFDELRRQELL